VPNSGCADLTDTNVECWRSLSAELMFERGGLRALRAQHYRRIMFLKSIYSIPAHHVIDELSLPTTYRLKESE